MSTQDPSPPPVRHDQAARPARPLARRVLRGAVICVLLLLLGIAGVLVRVWFAPLILPEAVTSRIEMRLDRAMLANTVQLGSVVLAAPQGGRAPVIEFRDVTLEELSPLTGAGDTGPDAAATTRRAAFPVVRVALSPGAMLLGRARPRRVQILGAGLQLTRDADGTIDAAFSNVETEQTATLAETMARLDAMVSSPVFTALDAIVATDLNFALIDAVTDRVIHLDNTQARLSRSDGVLILEVGGEVAGARDGHIDVVLTRDAAAGTTGLEVAFSNLAALDVSSATPALASLDMLRAPISGRLVGTLGDSGVLGAFRADLSIVAGLLTPVAGGQEWVINGLSAALSYTPEGRRLRIDGLSLDAPVLSLVADGHADIAPDGSGLVTQLRFSQILLAPPGQLAAPLPLDEATVDLRLTRAVDHAGLTLDLEQAVIVDGETRLSARGSAEFTPEGMALSLDGHLPEADLRALLAYWPPGAATVTREWVDENLLSGRVLGADVALRMTPGAPTQSEVQFDFDQLTMTPMRDGSPIEEASGYVLLSGRRLVLRVDEGRIPAPGGGAAHIDGSTMIIPDIRPPGPEAQFDLAITGGLSPVLRILDAPPFNIFAGGLMTPERLGSGSAEVRATLATTFAGADPNAPPGAALAGAGLRVEGILRDISTQTLVPGRDLTAERLDLVLVPGGITISGRAEFDGVPLTGAWSREFGPDVRNSNVEALVPLSPDVLDRLGVQLPPGLLEGEGRAEIALALSDAEPAILTVSTALDGLSLSLPPLGWQLAPVETGRLVVDIRLGPAPEVTSLSVEAGGLSLDGAITLQADGGLERLTARRFRIDDWLDVTGTLTGRGATLAPAIDVTGGVLDLRRAPSLGSGSQAGGGAPLRVALDRLQISQGIALTSLRADLTSTGGLAGQFRGLVDGRVPVSGSLVPEADGVAVRLSADDGGAVLRAAGILRNLHGGAMDLILRPTGETGNYRGQLTLASPRLRNAPAMAELLNAVSVVGLLDQLGGEGINLGAVEARFVLSPVRITIREGAAFGASLGLSMDGVYDISTRRLEMQGVISPLYMVNGIFGAIFSPRREGLFGFSYRLTGSAESPDVAVNPLSILTPGIFREIFRQEPPPPPEAP